MSCVITLFLNLQITRSDVRPHIKWAVSLVIAYGHFNLHQGFVGRYGLTYLLYRPQGMQSEGLPFVLSVHCSPPTQKQ